MRDVDYIVNLRWVSPYQVVPGTSEIGTGS